jgi:glucose/arabinose dehydrogenase
MHGHRILAGAAAAALLTTSLASPALAFGARVPDPIPALIAPGTVTVHLQTLASGLVSPVTGAVAPGDKKHLFVGEQRGKIWRLDVRGRGGAPQLFADLSSIVVPLGCFGINYDERGLFGIAFHPDYQHNGLLYTYSSQPPQGQPALPPNQCNARLPDHDNVVTEWHVSNPGSRNAMVNPASAREVLRNPHPQFNHNGGELRFGPDGFLYVSIGDGGVADDQGPGHAAGGNAQDLGSLNGKILRIDPNAGSATPGHSIPTDNPFAGMPAARGEIWALGFRNPYKMSFDRQTGALFVADVGQNDVEEIDQVWRGQNYGWPVKEGTFAFDNNGLADGFVTADPVSGRYVDPIAEYDHCIGPVDPGLVGPCPVKEGVAVVGGFVYRGHKVEGLRGRYVFGDYSQRFFGSVGRLFYLDATNQVRELKLDTGKPLGMSVLGLGQDARGELYVFAKSGARPGNTGITDLANATGVVMRITGADDTGDD